MSKLPAWLEEKRDARARLFAMNWAKPSPEKAEREALVHAHAKGFDSCYRELHVEMKLLVDALREIKGLYPNEVAGEAADEALARWKERFPDENRS